MKPARPRKRRLPAREPLARFLSPILIGAVGGACIGYVVSATYCQCSALASMDLHPVGVTILLGASAGVVREAIDPSSPFTPTTRRPWIIAGAAMADYLTDEEIRRQEGRHAPRTPAGAVFGAGLLGHAAILGWLLR